MVTRKEGEMRWHVSVRSMMDYSGKGGNLNYERYEKEGFIIPSHE